MRPLRMLTLLLPLVLCQFVSADWSAIDTFDDRNLGMLDGQGDWFASDIFEVVTSTGTALICFRKPSRAAPSSGSSVNVTRSIMST